MIRNTNGCKHDNDNNIHNKSDEKGLEDVGSRSFLPLTLGNTRRGL